jgi:hypothetical protein
MHHIQHDGRETAITGNYAPRCDGLCLVGGEKSYNEMLRVIELSPKTYFRVWIFQQNPTSRIETNDWCANF